MLPITPKLLDNYNRPRRNLKKLKAIIIHWTANTNRGANAMANRNYFNTKPYIKDRNGNKIYASAHYVVDDRNIIQCLPDNEVGFHVGARWSKYKTAALDMMGNPASGTDSPNNYTIGIEMCVNSDGDFSKTRQNTVDLVQFLLKKHQLGIDAVLRHFDITGKDCPKMMLDEEIWAEFKREITAEYTSPGNLKVNTSTLNVRSGPGTQHPIKRVLLNGEIVEKKGQYKLWYQIGPNEWIHSHYVIVL